MRILSVVAIAVAVFTWCTTAFAEDIFLYERTVEYQVVGPCNDLVMEGEVSLAWNDCGGTYALISVGGEDEHPMSVLIYTGSPDWSTMDPHVYQAFFCGADCTRKRPDVYCMPHDICAWYCYKTKVEYNCNTFWVMAYLPGNTALDILDIY